MILKCGVKYFVWGYHFLPYWDFHFLPYKGGFAFALQSLGFLCPSSQAFICPIPFLTSFYMPHFLPYKLLYSPFPSLQAFYTSFPSLQWGEEDNTELLSKSFLTSQEEDYYIKLNYETLPNPSLQTGKSRPTISYNWGYKFCM